MTPCPPINDYFVLLLQTIDFLLYNDSSSGVWEYLQGFGDSQNVTITNTSLLQLRELLNPNSSDSIWDILERTRDAANVSRPVPFTCK